MVFASICEHVSCAFIVASMSSEHFRNYKLQRALRNFSTSWNLSQLKRRLALSYQATR